MVSSDNNKKLETQKATHWWPFVRLPYAWRHAGSIDHLWPLRSRRILLAPSL